jgi:hypothetical protein
MLSGFPEIFVHVKVVPPKVPLQVGVEGTEAVILPADELP